ncbi:hypothetical protein EXU57_11675 [Segetibacter sp. 3557_3]|uniref:CvpA family protein n=1 Tax=Segetibacter sp. 3557_3 TaxID=2547429 RepID=UPI001058F44B|nr:CvpA family protein [Segetibacter sp. 3557_3]TDH26145.1 hypothetical protein EXU57_11675 [Segetibacter sp. 3557_3]
MNVIDILLILIILFSVWRGWHTGFISGLASLIVLAGSVWVALVGYPYVSTQLLSFFPSVAGWSEALAFILLLFLARIALGVLINAVISRLPKSSQDNVVNRALGVAPGFVNGLIYAALVSALLLSFPLPEQVSIKVSESYMAGYFSRPVEYFGEKLSPVFEDVPTPAMNNTTARPGSDGMLKLPFKVSDFKPRPDLEAQMLDLVNQERDTAGLNPLKADTALRSVARAHSHDMFARGYFSHVTPEGKSPSDRIRKARVRFLIAGENLAIGPNLKICHKGLMNSPGHKANILRRSYGRVGIGILDGGIHGIMITQNFRN